MRALAEHVGADRAVRHLRRDVEHARHAVERVEVLGERLPAEVDALGERRAGDVLDALHQLDQERLLARADRREADAAVAHHERGDAVPRRRREQRIPGDLSVVVGVHVHPAGRDDRAARVELARARAPATLPTPTMRPASIATSPVKRSRPVPSTIVPPRTTRSCMGPPALAQGSGAPRERRKRWGCSKAASAS